MTDHINQYLLLQQLLNSTFPIGSFSHSSGLETYVQEKKIQTGEQLKDFLFYYLTEILEGFEGVAFLKAYQCGQQKQIKEVQELDALICAMKLTKESKDASSKMGRAFYRTVLQLVQEDTAILLRQVWTKENKKINYCVIAGYCCAIFEMDKMQSLASFFFYSLNNILQTGVKCIPLGQTQGQIILFDLQDKISKSAAKLLEQKVDELSLCNFAPLYDIASMNHEFLYSRLYMS